MWSFHGVRARTPPRGPRRAGAHQTVSRGQRGRAAVGFSTTVEIKLRPVDTLSHKYSVSVYNFSRQTHTVHAQVPIDHCVSERLNDNVRSGEARFPKEAPRLGAHFKTHALLAPHVPLQAVEKAGNFAEGRRNMGSSTMPQRDTFHRSRGQAVCATRVA